MTHHTGAVPDTLRKPDWRTQGLCRHEEPELFFPTGSEGGWKAVITEAKKVCAHCPVAAACLQFAMDRNIDHGIFGGLTERERRAVRRRAAAKTKPAEPKPAPEPEYGSLREAWEARTTPLDGGHLGWTGPKTVYYRGVCYTPKRAAFLISRAARPYGNITSSCGLKACILPEHLADQVERQAAEVRGHRSAA